MNIDNIKIIMVGTTHPGNIGAAARAMNNMCFSRLVLVDPQCPVGEIAYARASGANCILDNRETFTTLEEAIADCQLVIAASARVRSLPWPQLESSEIATQINQMDVHSNTALVFGREQSGLNNEEIQMCNFMVSIPTNPEFSSLNVASAIQVLCYEVFKQVPVEQIEKPVDVQDRHASGGEVEGYFEHLQQVLESTGFLSTENPGLIMQRLRRLYLRAGLTHNEINILRGMLSAIKKYRSD
jgi:tRNA (cytidine32/uridine32-2'-O)-methyltransferase